MQHDCIGYKKCGKVKKEDKCEINKEEKTQKSNETLQKYGIKA